MGKTGPKPTVFLDGQVFGRLRVICEEPKAGLYQPRRWRCVCECGKETVAQQGSLRNGLHRSCGCLQIESAKQLCIKRNTTHSKSKTPEYKIWCGIIKRCEDPKEKSWVNYGERGITVCERWRHSFENFLADVGYRPSDKHSIDRHPDNNGNYEPGNVRWATSKEQSRNKRGNRILTFNGQTATVAEWAEKTGLLRHTILARIDRRGWTVEEALTLPSSPCKRRYRRGRLIAAATSEMSHHTP